MVDRITPDSPRWHHYCDNAFDVTNAVKHKWGDPTKLQRPIGRLFYCDVSSCGYNVNNPQLISENAMNNLLHGKTKKERKIVRDHYLSPQFIARFILDNQEIYLSDYSKFKKMFYISCGIVIVTQDENDRLAQLTKSNEDSNKFKVLIPTNKKYDHVGIKLLHYKEKSGHWKNRTYTPVSNDTLYYPPEIIEYEKRFLV